MRAAALAFALVLPFAASAQQDRRPLCVDWAAAGRLEEAAFRETGHPEGFGWFDYRIRITHPVWNSNGQRTATISIFGGAAFIITPPTLFFRSKAADGSWKFVGKEQVFSGRNGPFIPIIEPLDPEHRDWRPDGYERFLRPVRVAFEHGGGTRYEPEDAVPGYSEVRGGRLVALKGIYLWDLPALLATIPVDCRR